MLRVHGWSAPLYFMSEYYNTTKDTAETKQFTDYFPSQRHSHNRLSQIQMIFLEPWRHRHLQQQAMQCRIRAYGCFSLGILVTFISFFPSPWHSAYIDMHTANLCYKLLKVSSGYQSNDSGICHLHVFRIPLDFSRSTLLSSMPGVMCYLWGCPKHWALMIMPPQCSANWLPIRQKPTVLSALLYSLKPFIWHAVCCLRDLRDPAQATGKANFCSHRREWVREHQRERETERETICVNLCVFVFQFVSVYLCIMSNCI